MRNILIAIALVLFSFAVTVQAAPIQVERRDMKLATQQMIEKQTITNPVAASASRLLNGVAGPTSAAAASISSFAAQPDVPRNLTLTPGGTTADVKGCTVVVNGTNIFDQAITESFVVADNASSAVVGAKAFKTVTSVVFPANCEEDTFAATWSLGVGEKIGLKRCMDYAGHFVFSTVAGAYETTRATVTADADEVEKNTADFNGTMDGSNDFEAFFIQNFRCFP
jgi:hypothetical protein